MGKRERYTYFMRRGVRGTVCLVLLVAGDIMYTTVRETYDLLGGRFIGGNQMWQGLNVSDITSM